MIRQVPFNECCCDHCGKVGARAATGEMAAVLAFRAGFVVRAVAAGSSSVSAMLCPGCVHLSVPAGCS